MVQAPFVISEGEMVQEIRRKNGTNTQNSRKRDQQKSFIKRHKKAKVMESKESKENLLSVFMVFMKAGNFFMKKFPVNYFTKESGKENCSLKYK